MPSVTWPNRKTWSRIRFRNSVNGRKNWLWYLWIFKVIS